MDWQLQRRKCCLWDSVPYEGSQFSSFSSYIYSHNSMNTKEKLTLITERKDEKMLTMFRPANLVKSEIGRNLLKTLN